MRLDLLKDVGTSLNTKALALNRKDWSSSNRVIVDWVIGKNELMQL